MHPFNSINDTKVIPPALKEAILGLFNNAKLIFIGYRGDDESILNLLSDSGRINQVYWLNDEPPTNVKLSSWWQRLSTKTWVDEYNFDKIMLAMRDKFILEEPNFQARATMLERQYKISIGKESRELEEKIEKTDYDYMLLGNSLYFEQEYDRAIEAYKKAVKINPHSYPSYSGMGISYSWLGNFDEAAKSFTESININPNYSLAYVNLFELQLTQKKPFDKLLESKYIQLFENKSESFIQYEMLKILEGIVQKQEVDVDKWEQKYYGISLGGWIYDELREWIDGVEDIEVRDRLIEALIVFERHGQEQKNNLL